MNLVKPRTDRDGARFETARMKKRIDYEADSVGRKAEENSFTTRASQKDSDSRSTGEGIGGDLEKKGRGERSMIQGEEERQENNGLLLD